MIRVLLLFLAALVALPSAALSGSRLIGGASSTRITQLAALSPWATIGWLAILLLLLAGRWWWYAAVVAVLFVVQVSWVIPTWDARAAGGERPGSVPVRVMTINVKVDNPDLGAVRRLLRQQHVDLLVTQEGPADFVTALQADLHEQLPYAVSSPSAGLTGGTVIWSRWPIQRLEALPDQAGEISQVRLQVPGAVPVTVTGVHTISPGLGKAPAWNRDLAALTAMSSRFAGPQVMLGDFNASRDHAPFRSLLGTGLVDAAEAVRLPPWKAVTWRPTDRPWLPAVVRLDHVLVTPTSVGVSAVRVREVPGSDHRAVLADLEFKAVG